MGEVNVNIVLSEERFEKLRIDVHGNRSALKGDVVRHTPVDGVSVTVPKNQEVATEDQLGQPMTVEMFIEYVMWHVTENSMQQLST